MKASQNRKIIIFLFLFFSFSLLDNCGTSSKKLITKTYPEGFSLKHPKDWQIQIVDETFILASANESDIDSSLVLVYPFFLKQKTKSLTWLRQNLPNLTKFFSKIKFGKSKQMRKRPDESTIEFHFQRNNITHTGIALCSIFERSGILYVMGASEEDFKDKRNQLVEILESFQFEEPKKSKLDVPSPPKIKYSTWQDPVEKAFNLEAPQGWKIEGGTFRRAAVDLVHVLVATSPDQKIRIQFNDTNIPAFTAPSPILSMAGFTEGSWYSPGYGVRMMVKRYTPGLYFLSEYLQKNYAPNLGNFKIISQNNRPDVANTFNKLYSQFAAYGISFTLHAGEIAFRYKQNSIPSVGYGMALTQIVQSMAMQGGTWSVPLLVIYICPDTKSEMVHQISDHMFRSVRINPQWAASQQQLATNVSQIVTQTNQEISNIINDSYWARQRTLDDINRRFSNYILGVTDIVDPETGEKWKVESGHNYYWRKNYTDQVIGTEVFERPDIDFSSLKEY